MIILNTSTGGQTFNIIPRSAASSPTFELLDKSTRVSSNIGIDVTNANGYMTITGFFSLKEGRFYNIVVKNGSNSIIYRDKIFVTDQTIGNGDFTINSGEYVTSGAAAMNDDEYVII